MFNLYPDAKGGGEGPFIVIWIIERSKSLMCVSLMEVPIRESVIRQTVRPAERWCVRSVWRYSWKQPCYRHMTRDQSSMQYKRVWCVYTLMLTTQSLGTSRSNQMEIHAHPCRNTANFLSRHAWHGHVEKMDSRTKTSRSVIPLRVLFWKWGERKQGKGAKMQTETNLTDRRKSSGALLCLFSEFVHSLYNLSML